MEFLLNDERYNFLIGKVEFLYLRPFSFLEYLQEIYPTLLDPLMQIDYVISLESEIYPIKVKAGSTGKLRAIA